MSFVIKANKNIIDMQYAVRGPIAQQATKMVKNGKNIIPCNIGNPHSLGQNPLTFVRQVISLVECPELIQHQRTLIPIQKNSISEYTLEYADNIVKNLSYGLGAYTESKGPRFIRDKIAKFIDNRDQPTTCLANSDNIFLTNGASEGAKSILEILITQANDGIMIPTPQYPLYSATICKCGGVQVNYYPNEDKEWALDKHELQRAYSKAVANGVNIKALVVINPGNPTGAILDKKSIADVVDFAEEKQLAIIADEVYQENIYGGEFISFAKAITNRKITLFSLHSTSKGFFGECGHRGGYLEVRNPPMIEQTTLTFMDLITKQASVHLCSNTAGQIITYLMVKPPANNSEDYKLYNTERNHILQELEEKAYLVKEAFKQMDGVQCFGKLGAMYLFPRLNKLPKGKTDFDYCMALLQETGVCTVNGMGFGQAENTWHLRIAFLPPKEMLKTVLPKWIKFHNKYVNQ